MNRIVSRLLSLSLLLALTLGCNKDKGPSPDALTDDPTGLPMPSPDCRIVKETLKMAMEPADNWPDAEIITIEGGRKVKVGRIYTSSYLYDPQGRLSQILFSMGLGAIEELTYGYSAKTLTQHFISKKIDGSIRTNTQIASLNSQGFISGPFRNETEWQPIYLEYDEEGHQTKVYSTWPDGSRRVIEHNVYENGQRLKQYTLSGYRTGDTLTNSYSYDVNRPNLPEPRTYSGRNSRNLPKRVLLTSKHSVFADGPLYETRYSYLFDRQGRVRRRIAVGYQRNPQYLIEENVGTVNVTDYEYECP